MPAGRAGGPQLGQSGGGYRAVISGRLCVLQRHILLGSGEAHHGIQEREAITVGGRGKFGRRLSASEWTLVDSDGSFDRDALYDEHDFVDLLAFMTKRLPPKAIPRPDRERAQARAHVHEVATRVKGLVANERQRLFGAPDPPFKDAAQAAQWIESQVTPQETSRLTISVELPAAELGFGLLRALRDWLDRTLPATDDEVGFAEVMRGAVGLRTIDVGTDVLPYLPAVDASIHEVGVRRVYVQYGSRLGAVREAAERIAAATGWEVLAAVHHLLTGGGRWPVRFGRPTVFMHRSRAPSSRQRPSRCLTRRASVQTPWPGPTRLSEKAAPGGASERVRLITTASSRSCRSTLE